MLCYTVYGAFYNRQSFQVGHEVAHLQRRVRARELQRRRHEEAALRQPGDSPPPEPAASAAPGLPTLPEGSHARGAEQESKSRGGKFQAGICSQ